MFIIFIEVFMIIEVFGKWLNPDNITSILDSCIYFTCDELPTNFPDRADSEIAQEVNKQIRITENTKRNYLDNIIYDMADKIHGMYYKPYPKDKPVETDNI